MSNPLIILQGAMGAGLIFLLVGLVLLVAFSIGYTAMYISYGKNKYLKVSNEDNRKKELLVYIVSLVFGILTAIITITLLILLLLFFFGDVPLD